MRPTVIDLGCADRGQWNSIHELARHYRPTRIYGFDPSPQTTTGTYTIDYDDGPPVPVTVERTAAWIMNGEVPFEDDLILGGGGPRGYAPYSQISLGRLGTIGEGTELVSCFDFSAFLEQTGPAVVKMDIEGAEYGLLNHLLEHDTARLMTELLIEWHDHPDSRITRALVDAGVTIKDWWM